MLLTSSVHIPGGWTLPMRGRYPPPLCGSSYAYFCVRLFCFLRVKLWHESHSTLLGSVALVSLVREVCEV